MKNLMFDNSIIFDNPMLVRYMEEPFRDWKFKGWARNISSEKFGLVGIDKYDYVTVFTKNFSNKIESDAENLERPYLDKGYYGIVLFYGSDNTSYMVRYKQGQLQKGKVELSVFDDEFLKKSLFYNS